MDEIKVNLTMLLPGRTMLSEQECLRKVRKPLMGKGKNAGKPVINKKGEEVWATVKEYDPAKSERFSIDICDNNGNEVPTTVFIRGTKNATKIMNLGISSYKYFVSDEMPSGFHAPKTFKGNPKFKKSFDEQAWLRMSKTERLEWHLNNICTSMGGTLESYHVFDN